MAFLYPDLAKPVKRGVVQIIKEFFLLGVLSFMVGCVNPFPDKGSARLQLSEPGSVVEKVVEEKITLKKGLGVTLNENVPGVVILPYKSEGGAVPTSCDTAL